MDTPLLPDPENGVPDAGDGKDPGAFRTIGEVAKTLGIRQHVLRYWEEQFPALRPLTRAGGRRYYRPQDVALLTEINRLLNHEGYTIKGARQALRGKKASVAEPSVAATLPAAVPGVADAIRAIRDRLAAALNG
ncbi:MerR family transcriptional regulator [Novosphingobium sp. MMS21-SN21R]|uniref:MerR family transcriptional regulator n=1 Tax=Novosphingobium sp. MMS21-SN21R TaxID=2969298 RepID=UPI00288556C1|nr:MerR family transcriptional regulator [Novosphingobium sp. MMS21-SN21R]MDT0507717.1 MerR family transcriptional regulator [Novosphingobium sp. MMS21-SN21R]